MFHSKNFFDSVHTAGLGFCEAVLTEHNPKCFGQIFLCGCLILLLFHGSEAAWWIMTCSYVGVTSTELLNTAIEKLFDLVEPEKNETVRYAKDVAAGASFVWGMFFFLAPFITIVKNTELIDITKQIIVTCLPVMVGCILAFLVASHSSRVLRHPIDNWYVLSDGNRLFGNSKTWLGLCLMVVFSAVGYVISYESGLYASSYNLLREYDSLFDVICIGADLGLAYGLFELPTSYIKRRLGVDASESHTTSGWLKFFCRVCDYLDSSIGGCIVLSVLCDFSIVQTILWILITAAIHVIVNVVLFLIGLRRHG